MVPEWTRRGEETCARIYGDNYRKLRENIKELHPAMDLWMVTEGYGRTMARPGLDLLRRELCTVAQMAVLEAPRQLHSHLRGALHAGGSFEQVDGVPVRGQSALVLRSVEKGEGDVEWGEGGVGGGGVSRGS